MEKFVNSYDRECMKMAMLKHEETFREQVYELHRLYQIQKMLMKNIARSRPKAENQEKWNAKNGTCWNYQKEKLHQNNSDSQEQPAQEYVTEILDDDGRLEIEDESEIELTLAPTSYNRRRKAETPLTSDSAPSFSSSSTGSNHIKRGERSGENVSMHKWGLVEVPGCSNPPNFLCGRNNGSDIEEQLRQADRLNQHQPPWLYQVLSLNMT